MCGLQICVVPVDNLGLCAKCGNGFDRSESVLGNSGCLGVQSDLYEKTGQSRRAVLLACILTTRASIGASRPMHPPTVRIIAGIMLMVIRASFHCTLSATMKAEKKSDSPVIIETSFSAMP